MHVSDEKPRAPFELMLGAGNPLTSFVAVDKQRIGLDTAAFVSGKAIAVDFVPEFPAASAMRLTFSDHQDRLQAKCGQEIRYGINACSLAGRDLLRCSLLVLCGGEYNIPARDESGPHRRSGRHPASVRRLLRSD